MVIFENLFQSHAGQNFFLQTTWTFLLTKKETFQTELLSFKIFLILHKVQILINGPYMLQLSIMTHDLCLLGDQRDFLVRFPSPVSTARNFNEIQMF